MLRPPQLAVLHAATEAAPFDEQTFSNADIVKIARSWLLLDAVTSSMQGCCMIVFLLLLFELQDLAVYGTAARAVTVVARCWQGKGSAVTVYGSSTGKKHVAKCMRC